MPIDPRAYSEEKLEAPNPLPFVSRKALKRVKNPLPTPKTCNVCTSPCVELVCNDEIYNGRQYGDWPYAYLCDDCGAYVGLHPNTDIPLGILADSETREARKIHKQAFLKLQASRSWSRREAYAWLAEAMNIPVGECHWGWFDKSQCEKAGAICSQAMQSSGPMAQQLRDLGLASSAGA